MKILVVATKSPWPPVDGGRLLLKSTLEGLAARGHRLTLVAPRAAGRRSEPNLRPQLEATGCSAHLVPIATRSHLTSLVLSLAARRPLSIDRHGHRVVRREVERLVLRESWDLVHVEQLQALSQARPARTRGIPLVLRAQNVESELWGAAARLQPWSLLGQWEAGRLGRWEGRAVARAAATIALTERDAGRLTELSGGEGRVHVVRAPYDLQLPAREQALAGSPALVLLGSEGWSPNRDAVRFFGESVWPALRAAFPQATLHVFGNWHPNLGETRVQRVSPCLDSRQAFATGSILLLPLRFASGVRMRILEAWARGVPVIATPEAAAGLDHEDGHNLLLAADGPGFVAAVSRLVGDTESVRRLISGGRATLAAFHDPASAAAQLEAIYREVCVGSGRKSASARPAAR